MDVNPKIELHMEDYGGPAKDVIILGKPGARAQINLKNQAGAMMKEQGDNPSNVGDVELLMILAYVKQAPFAATIGDFLDYCDTLEDQGAALFEAMTAHVKELGGLTVFQN